MPVTVKRVRSKYRVVEAATGDIAKNEQGTPVDGGGHSTEAKAMGQMRAINSSLQKRGKI